MFLKLNKFVEGARVVVSVDDERVTFVHSAG